MTFMSVLVDGRERERGREVLVEGKHSGVAEEEEEEEEREIEREGQ